MFSYSGVIRLTRTTNFQIIYIALYFPFLKMWPSKNLSWFSSMTQSPGSVAVCSMWSRYKLYLTYLSIHGHHGLGDALHGLSHGVVWFEGLDFKGHCLNVCSHQNELFYVSPCPHKVFGHDLHSILEKSSLRDMCHN